MQVIIKPFNQFLSRLSIVLGLIFILGACGSTDQISLGGTGISGSLARFTISGNYLYVVTETDLHTFDISNPDQTVKIAEELYVGSDVETIFSYGGKLFLGKRSGLAIIDITDNPAQPKFLTNYWHITSCDPVVVAGNYAYMTLRSGTDCRNGVNSLDILDVSSIEEPRLISSTLMINPHGLGVNDSLLFVTEGNHGLKVFDRTYPDSLLLISQIDNIIATDVIINGVTLIVVGNGLLYQYDFSDPKELKLISTL